MNFKRVLCGVSVVVGLALSSPPAQASVLHLDVAAAQPVLAAPGAKTTYLKVGLTGLDLGRRPRTGVNVAIVLDRSGSMQGAKLAHAKEAAINALNRLSTDDLVSVIAYDDEITVLVPATRLSDRERLIAAISRLEPGGSTALFAGVSKGAAELRKFLDHNRVNRIVLLSDGLANVGPDSPSELAELGASLQKEGISVTTIGLGLGYNEDLMSRLAAASDGNHAFVENPRDLARVFDLEFGDLLSVVAQEIVVNITCPDGVRPLRVLGHKAEIIGNRVAVVLNQLYSGHERYVLLELEVGPGTPGQQQRLAEVTVSYANMAERTSERVNGSASARYTASVAEVARHENQTVMVAVVEQIANAQNELALQLRDEGDLVGAQQMLTSNASFLEKQADKYESEELKEQAEQNLLDSQNLDEQKWERSRKVMREQQSKIKQQRKW